MPEMLVNARYLRVQASRYVHGIRMDQGGAIDATSARRELSDLEAVIDAASADPRAADFVANVQYMAGGTALNYVKDADAAYRYWEQCARAEHAGCMNVMADARLTGAGGQRVDIQESLALHRRIYATSTKFSCAGAYSALSIASIGFFVEVRRSGEDEALWLTRAYELLDEIGARLGNKDPCNRSQFETVDFLFRLSKGERREPLLRAAIERASSPEVRAIAQHLLGSLDQSAASAAALAPAPPFDSCWRHFALLWHASIRNDRETALSRHRSMVALGPTFCGTELRYAKKFGF